MTALPLTLLLVAGAGNAGAPATPTPARPADAAAATANGASTAASDDAAKVPPGTAEAQARIDADAARAAARRAELDALRTQLTTLQSEVATLRDRTALAEENLAAARDEAATDRAARAAAADAAARSTRRRAELTGQALQQLDASLRALAAGDASGVDAALASQADALETARLQAGWQKSPQEALQAGQGEAFVGAAREALSRGDLHEARLALGRAAAATAGARALAEQGAPDEVAPGSATRPPAQGQETRASYPPGR